MTSTASTRNDVKIDKSQTPWRRGMRRFVRNKLAMFGLAIIVFFLLFCFVVPLFWQTDQVHTDLKSAMLPPGSPGHPLGTNDLGYDVLGRLMQGGQISILIGLAAGVLAPVGFVLPMSVGAVLMSLSTIVVALNAQLLRRLNLSPDAVVDK
mgnify:CR=1 FL=1